MILIHFSRGSLKKIKTIYIFSLIDTVNKIKERLKAKNINNKLRKRIKKEKEKSYLKKKKRRTKNQKKEKTIVRRFTPEQMREPKFIGATNEDV